MGKYFQTKCYFFLIFLNSFLENFESLNFNYTKMFNPKLQGGCLNKIIAGRDFALQKAFFDWADISVVRHFGGPTFRWPDISVARHFGGPTFRLFSTGLAHRRCNLSQKVFPLDKSHKI